MKVLGYFVLGWVLAAPVAAQERTSAAIETKIIAMEKAWNQAYKLRDKKALNAILDDAIVLVNDDGSLQAKGAFLASIGAPEASDEQQVSPESIRVHVVGDVAISTGMFVSKGIENGKPYVRRDRFVDTWIRKGEEWTCVSATATPVLR